MKNKNLFKILILVMLIILTVGFASAADDADNMTVSDDTSGDTDNIVGISEEDVQTDDVISLSNDDVIGEEEFGTYVDLKNLIDSCPEGSTIDLNKSYRYGGNGYFTITKQLTIDGHGHTVDGNNYRAIEVEHSNIVFKNIHFSGRSSYGSAIYTKGAYNNLTFINCTFHATSQVSSSYDGGLVYINGGSNTFIDCSFNDTTGNKDYYTHSGGKNYYHNSNIKNGGLVYLNGGDNYFEGCNFTNAYASYYGGAIFINGDNNTVRDSMFINNSVTYFNHNTDGGSIYFNGSDNKVINSNFTDFTCGRNGGAIYFNGSNNSVINSSFKRDYYNTYFSYNDDFEKADFITNNRPQQGVAIYFAGTAVLKIQLSIWECPVREFILQVPTVM